MPLYGLISFCQKHSGNSLILKLACKLISLIQSSCLEFVCFSGFFFRLLPLGVGGHKHNFDYSDRIVGPKHYLCHQFLFLFLPFILIVVFK